MAHEEQLLPHFARQSTSLDGIAQTVPNHVHVAWPDPAERGKRRHLLVMAIATENIEDHHMIEIETDTDQIAAVTRKETSMNPKTVSWM